MSTVAIPASHSRAPWTIDGLFDAEVGVSILSADGDPIVELQPLTGEWSAEEIANAYVIAAAPALYRELRVAHEALLYHPAGDYRTPDQIAAAAAALARAEEVAPDVCDTCGCSLAHVVGPGVEAVLCPVCNWDSTVFEEDCRRA